MGDHNTTSETEAPATVVDEINDWVAMSNVLGDLELAQAHLGVLIALLRPGRGTPQAQAQAAAAGDAFGGGFGDYGSFDGRQRGQAGR